MADSIFADKIKIEVSPSKIDGTRGNGGSDKTAGDHPYIKGYFYIFFFLPSKLFEKSDIATSDAQNILMVSAENYTPPGDRQLNLQDVQGQGGVDSSFLVGQTITREFSVQYKDYWGAPIFRIHKVWANYIDPYFGLSKTGTFSPDEYKGSCIVIQTKPVKRTKDEWGTDDIIKIDYFDGVQPMTDLKSAYDANITANDFVKPTVQYKFDGFPLDETNGQVLNGALGLLKKKDELFRKTDDMYSSLLNTNLTT